MDDREIAVQLINEMPDCLLPSVVACIKALIESDKCTGNDEKVVVLKKGADKAEEDIDSSKKDIARAKSDDSRFKKGSGKAKSGDSRAKGGFDKVKKEDKSVSFEDTDDIIDSEDDMIDLDGDIGSVATEPIKVYIKSKGVNATALYYSRNRLVVLKGSQLSTTTSEHCSSGIFDIRHSSKVDMNFILLEDIECSSPSFGGGLVRGASSNGWADWKDENGTPLGQLVNRSPAYSKHQAIMRRKEQEEKERNSVCIMDSFVSLVVNNLVSKVKVNMSDIAKEHCDKYYRKVFTLEGDFGRAQFKVMRNGYLLLKYSGINRFTDKTAPVYVDRFREQFAQYISSDSKLTANILFGDITYLTCFITGAEITNRNIWYTRDGSRINCIDL